MQFTRKVIKIVSLECVFKVQKQSKFKSNRRKTKFSFNVIHFLDVEVQTTNSPHRMPLHRSSLGVEQSLINTPFTRDPNVPIQCPLEDPTHHKSRGFQTANECDTIQSSKSHIPYSVNLQK